MITLFHNLKKCTYFDKNPPSFITSLVPVSKTVSVFKLWLMSWWVWKNKKNTRLLFPLIFINILKCLWDTSLLQLINRLFICVLGKCNTTQTGLGLNFRGLTQRPRTHRCTDRGLRGPRWALAAPHKPSHCPGFPRSQSPETEPWGLRPAGPRGASLALDQFLGLAVHKSGCF